MDKRNYKSSFFQNGFTLIELLVVIAIVALLMSILVLALKRIREQSKTAGCLSNLRQWGIIFEMYSQENDGRFWGAAGPRFWISDIYLFSPKYMDIVKKSGFARLLKNPNGTPLQTRLEAMVSMAMSVPIHPLLLS